MLPRRLQVGDRTREFLDCTPTGGRAVPSAVSEYMSDGPPPSESATTVAEITNKVLGMLQAGELAPAQRYAQEWLAKGASTEGVDETAKKRWEMTRELLAAAWEIPMPITKALAKGIDGNNPATAADECKAFAKQSAEGAAAAYKALASKAPGLHAYIPGALKAGAAAPKQAAAPRPMYYDYSPPPVYTSSSSSSGGAGASGCTAADLLRLLASARVHVVELVERRLAHLERGCRHHRRVHSLRRSELAQLVVRRRLQLSPVVQLRQQLRLQLRQVSGAAARSRRHQQEQRSLRLRRGR